MNVEEQLIKLISGVSDLNAKVDTLQQSMDTLKSVADRVTQHDTKLETIMTSLQRGNQKFDKIDTKLDRVDERIDKLENADANKAKDTLKTIGNYILIAIVGAIVANIPNIISALAGGQ